MKSNFLRRIYNTFFFSKIDKKLYNHFKIKENSIKTNKKILVQGVEDYYYFSLFGTIIKSLVKKNNNITMEHYIPRNLAIGSTTSVFGFLKSTIFNTRYRDKKWSKLYSSYSHKMAFSNEGSTKLSFDLLSFIKAYKIYKKIKNKKDVLNLSIDNINVGDLVYDSYLRYKPAPIVDIDDFYLCIIIWQSLRNIQNSKTYFTNNKVIFLLTSYSSYIHHGITARVAIQHNVKVYAFGDYGSFYQELNEIYPFHSKNCRNYLNDFNKIKHNIDLSLSKEALENRFRGTIDLATSYMQISAYKNNNENVPNVKASVVIFLHDFFDSPHIYEHMVFCDFYDWIETTIELLISNNINFFIKPHPNQIDESKNVVEDLKLKYKNLKFLSTKITNLQLVEHGIKAGISVYGTVAHELAYLNIPVVLCGENPHSCYNFCFEAKDIKEYSNLIKEINNLEVPKNSKYEIESFYYMHNLLNTDEMLQLLKNISDLRNLSAELDDNLFEKYKQIIKLIINNKEFDSFILKLEESL